MMIDTRREGGHDRAGPEAPRRGCIQPVGRHAAQGCDGSITLLPGESETTRAGFFKALEWAVLAIPERAALSKGLVKQSVRERRGHQDADGHGAGGFAEQGDVI